jgi:hypothetical protein
MPVYTYKKNSTDEYRDIFQSMKDKHEYFGENGDEDDWIRVFYSPNASIDTSIDPFSSKEFNDRTASKKGTVGDMLDYSKEMSQKRADLAGGKDPIKEKYFENYSKERNGAKHLEQMKSFESKSVKVDYAGP